MFMKEKKMIILIFKYHEVNPGLFLFLFLFCFVFCFFSGLLERTVLVH